jgi:AcrR family transcriptional regulator
MGREKQILQAAEDLIYEYGFDGVGVDAIAEKAGITGGGIYRHFSGKAEILAVLFDQAIDTVLERLPVQTDDAEHDLRNLVEAHVHFAQTHPKLAGIWTREQRSLSDPHRRGYLRRERRYNDRWRECLTRCYPGRSAEDISVAMRALHALMLSDAMRPVGSKSGKRTEELLIAMAVGSLTALQR